MLDQLSVLKLVTGRLDAARIPYTITGSIAAGLYVQPRFTRDTDLVIEPQPVGRERLAIRVVCQLDCEVAFIARRRLEATGLVTSVAVPTAMMHSTHDRQSPR